VRVLVDQDRDEDPYRSTVINEIAVGFLRDAGVDVWRDAPATLLHSKFVLIDSDLTVIGSHNWSAGSYFQFDDMSLAIRSAATTAAQRARFDVLWAAAG
jgi:phosphatidylserine/phosphatidylglycerophosphate/cardiolipin synthase-like enzyme